MTAPQAAPLIASWGNVRKPVIGMLHLAVLTANPGSWSGNPTSFTYQWQRCDVDVAVCSNIVSATSKTYTVTSAEFGYRLRVRVTAHNAKGSATASSAITAVVQPAVRITNRRPTLRILKVQFLGAKVYARFRICDDSFKNLTIIETDSRPGKLSYTRRFATLAVLRRDWGALGGVLRGAVDATRIRRPLIRRRGYGDT